MSSDVVNVNVAVEDFNSDTGSVSVDVLKNLLLSKLNSFSTTEVNFCVNPEGYNTASSRRRNIRIVANARNASGVETIDLDSDDNECRN